MGNIEKKEAVISQIFKSQSHQRKPETTGNR